MLLKDSIGLGHVGWGRPSEPGESRAPTAAARPRLQSTLAEKPRSKMVLEMPPSAAWWDLSIALDP